MKRIFYVLVLMFLAAYSSAIMVLANGATGATIVLSPDTTTPPNTTFVLNLTINNVNDMRAWDVVLVYPKILTLQLVDTINDTPFTDGPGLAIFNTEDVNSTYSWSDIARTTQSIVPGSGTGSGVVARLYFIGVSNGKAKIDFALPNCQLMDSSMKDIPITGATAPTITIAIPTPTPSPAPKSVGGISFSLAKPTSSAAYIGLASIALVAIVATTVYFRGIKRRKEKQ